jgi:hypothetical protein
MDNWDVRPIAPADTSALVTRCWPDDPAAARRLFSAQATIGMAAWDGATCVGMLHCYAVDLPSLDSADWPTWNQWWSSVVGFDAPLSGRAWCHACFHVGRIVAQARIDDDPDASYFGRGIATALCRASVGWAKENGYAHVFGPGAPSALPAFSVWAGSLPWTTYAKLGFREVASLGSRDELPGWARGESPPHVMAQARDALAEGRSPADFVTRLMQFDL